MTEIPEHLLKRAQAAAQFAKSEIISSGVKGDKKVEIDKDNMNISHRGSKGMMCSASIDFPSEFLLETDIECLITIKNSFGKQCTGSKMWKGI